MREIKYLHEWEIQLADGNLRVYAGHPCYCQKTERHRMHVFRYEYRLRDGSIVQGHYLCDGDAQEPLPPRYCDLPTDALGPLETTRNRPVDATGSGL